MRMVPSPTEATSHGNLNIVFFCGYWTNSGVTLLMSVGILLFMAVYIILDDII